MLVMSDAPRANTAAYHVLTAGYYERGVASTVGLIRDGAVLVVVDPGMVRDRALILDPLAALGVQPHEVTDVVFSHHHPDHTINAALFPAARYHDHWAIYENDVWTSRDAEGFELSPSIKLIRTPGHSPQDITTLAQTSDGVAALHPRVVERGRARRGPVRRHGAAACQSRARVLAVADVAIPGHGPAFAPSEATPR
jgi:glyoxylase-like metal-dependent hydrolase (beta-lactamase superfamily II)